MKNTVANNTKAIIDTTDQIQVLIDQVSDDADQMFKNINVDLVIRHPKRALRAIAIKFLKDHQGHIKKGGLIGQSLAERITPDVK